ncbi:hypothetical protein EVG20_g8188 [Dentipellis fragilis]|uniref:GED domain-containing protein n=1 Tax=Dentipellis fragilis TaxID=205917 RepID=A0A4Y9Y8G5_9AGAM|nr:hypothetical protein EVG20_g8188 [Dentipellis fragilis]
MVVKYQEYVHLFFLTTKRPQPYPIIKQIPVSNELLPPIRSRERLRGRSATSDGISTTALSMFTAQRLETREKKTTYAYTLRLHTPFPDMSSDSRFHSSMGDDVDMSPADGIGLSDPQYAARRRRMLDLINRLKGTGAQLDIDLPEIAVIGSQSAGKSSLIESISGISLPRASGTCTRCPTECQLSHSDRPWQCRVSLRRVTDALGADLGHATDDQFGDIITSKADVTERIRRAQRAILNPSANFQAFLQGADADPDVMELSFSKNTICLQISGADVADLSFVDLPGIIQSVATGGNPEDVELIRELAISYIRKPSCIILLTVACETDLENQAAYGLASQYDPSHARTVGVLTKPDRIEPGNEQNWLPVIRGERSESIYWFCVKNPTTEMLNAGITWEAARAHEAAFFAQEMPWAGLGAVHKRRLGTDKLTARLSEMLAELIAKRLPELRKELEHLLALTQRELDVLPPSPSHEPIGELMRLVGAFTRGVEKHVVGTPVAEGLLQALRPMQQEFFEAIRSTVPEFAPWERCQVTGRNIRTIAGPAFLKGEAEDLSVWDVEVDEDVMCIDEVMERADTAVTRELPNNYPFIVIKQLILDVVEEWEEPALCLYESTKRTLLEHAQRLVAEHFGAFEHGGLKGRVSYAGLCLCRYIVAEHIRAFAEQTLPRIEFLLKGEAEPYTRNRHYFLDYSAKSLEHFTNLRRQRPTARPIKEKCLAEAIYPSRPFINGVFIPEERPVGYTSSSRAQTSTRSETVNTLDPMASALGIMADARAYFQGVQPISFEFPRTTVYSGRNGYADPINTCTAVAYKRFVDNVPMTLDQSLVLGILDGLDSAIFRGLGVNGEDAYENCRRLLAEPEERRAVRGQLERRKERLLGAQRELEEVFVQ